MANIEFAGFLFDALGVAVQSATVDLVDRNTTTPVRATTTTDSNGFYTISHGTEGRFDIRITSGTDVLWRKYDTSGQMTELEVASLNIRNPADTFKYDLLPASIAADRTLTLPLLTGTATMVVTPAVEDLDMGGFDIDNAGFHILNAATAPASTEVYLVHDNTGDLTLNALSGKTLNLAVAGTDEFVFSAASLDMLNNTLLNVGAAGNDWTTNRLAVQGALVGSSQVILLDNTDNTNTASHAEFQLFSGGSSGGDAKLRMSILSAQDWGLGVDNSNGDIFVIGPSLTLGANDALRITTATPPVISFNTTQGADFDYVCDLCGRHKAEQFACCGQVEWHDDVLPILHGVFNQMSVVDHLTDLGILTRSVSVRGDDEIFMNMTSAVIFSWNIGAQNRQRMDAQYAELQRRMVALGG